MQNMEHDENREEHPAPPHHPCGESRLGISFEGVSDGSRGPAHASELNGGGDVKRHTYQQDDPDKPE